MDTPYPVASESPRLFATEHTLLIAPFTSLLTCLIIIFPIGEKLLEFLKQA